MEQRYVNVCKQLIDLGYKYTLQPESLLLVEKLLGDLIETTENLRKYMKIAQDAVEERDNLKFGAEPYKCDNARLIKECNELHLAFLQVKEQNEKQQKELRQQIIKLEREKQEFIESHKKLRDRLRELELDAVRKTDRFLSRQSGNKVKSSSTSVLLHTQKDKSNNFQINSAMALADQKIANLMKEITKLKDHQLQLAEVNNEMKNKLISREKEIQRLGGLLEGGRPTNALNADCCYQNINTKLEGKDNEICYLQKMKTDLENKLKDARCKQHEAMKNALHLADRNNQLEKELRDIDQMALAVEEECNSTVKCNSKKVKRLQDRLHTSIVELQQLEKRAADLKREKQSLQADLEAVKIEKRHLQTVLETALEDKKRLTDRINKFTVIEKDLNKEIDSLVRTSTEQKRLIAELKGRALAQNFHCKFKDNSIDVDERRSPKKTVKSSKPTKKHLSKISTSPKKKEQKTSHKIADIYYWNMDPCSEQDVPCNTPAGVINCTETNEYSTIQQQQCCNTYESNLSVQQIKEIVDDEISKRVPQQTNSLDRIKNERDFYIKEYQHLLEQFRNVQIRHEENDQDSTLIKILHEKEELIVCLQHENQTLSKEKHNLMSRLENIRDYSDNNDYLTIKSSLKRLERERDLLKTDVDRLEEERDSIKHRIKVSTDLHAAEIERYQQMITDNETQIRKLEQERHDMTQNQGSRRATITNLEDQCETLKDQLKRTQDELSHQRTVYSQLKILHEQTDKALADSQGQLMQVEKELSCYQDKHNTFDNNTAVLNQEIAALRKDIAILKQSLNDMDQEKDNILLKVDDKTERIAILEQEVIFKDGKINQLESNLSELRGKISSTLDDRNSKDYQLRTTSSEMTNLKSELQTATRAKEAAFQENRSLNDMDGNYKQRIFETTDKFEKIQIKSSHVYHSSEQNAKILECDVLDSIDENVPESSGLSVLNSSEEAVPGTLKNEMKYLSNKYSNEVIKSEEVHQGLKMLENKTSCNSLFANYYNTQTASDDQLVGIQILEDNIADTSCTVIHELATKHVSNMSIPNDILPLQKGKFERKRNKYVCIFCHKEQMNLSRHLLLMHQEEDELKEIISLQKKSPERNKLLAILRKKCMYQQNINNTKNKIVIRKSKNANIEYFPCPSCRGYYSKIYLARHQRKCINRAPNRPRVIIESKNMLASNLNISKRIQQKLFMDIRDDEIGLAVKQDKTIKLLALRMSEKHMHERHLSNYMRQKLRQLGRLLLVLREVDPTITSLESSFVPSKYNNFKEAIYRLGNLNEDEYKYNNPYLAAQMGTIITECVNVLLVQNIKDSLDTTEIQQDLNRFLTVHKAEYGQQIAKSALSDMKQLQWNKKIDIPSVEDLNKLQLYLKMQAEQNFNTLQTKGFNYHQWYILLRCTMVLLLTFNRRRTGEMSQILIKNYNDKQKITGDSLRTFNRLEKILANNLHRMEIRGKFNRRVPVLLLPIHNKYIDTILKFRRVAGVNDSNHYLFGTCHKIGYIHCSKILAEFSDKCGASNPKSLRGTKMRKQVATMSQLLNLNENEIQQLADFMGHDIGIHRLHYRIPEITQQITKLSRFFMAANDEDLNKFKDKSLKELETLDPSIMIVDDISDEDNDDDSSFPNEDFILSASSVNDNFLQDIEVSISEEKGKTDFGLSNVFTSPKKRVFRKRNAWKLCEIKILRKEMAKYFETKTFPSGKECMELLRKYTELKHRTTAQIKAFLQYQHKNIQVVSKSI